MKKTDLYTSLVQRNIIDPNGVQIVAECLAEPSIGKSVVTTKAYKRNEHVCSYGGPILSDRQYDALLTEHTTTCPRVSYMYYLRSGATVDGFPKLPEALGHCGSFVNDPRGIANAKANVKFCKTYWTDTKTNKRHVFVTLKATRSIGAGEELWLDYGSEYWPEMLRDTRQCDCEFSK